MELSEECGFGELMKQGTVEKVAKAVGHQSNFCADDMMTTNNFIVVREQTNAEAITICV